MHAYTIKHIIWGLTLFCLLSAAESWADILSCILRQWAITASSTVMGLALTGLRSFDSVPDSKSLCRARNGSVRLNCPYRSCRNTSFLRAYEENNTIDWWAYIKEYHVHFLVKTVFLIALHIHNCLYVISKSSLFGDIHLNIQLCWIFRIMWINSDHYRNTVCKLFK